MEATRPFSSAAAGAELETLTSKTRLKIAEAQPATEKNVSSNSGRKTRANVAVIFGLTTVIPLLVMVHIIHAILVLHRSTDLAWVGALGLIALGIALLGGKLMKEYWRRIGEAVEAIDRLGKESHLSQKPRQLKAADEIDRIPTVVNHLVRVAKRQGDRLKNYSKQIQTLDMKLKEVNRQLHEVTREDSLTGLYNRKYFDSCVRHEMFRARRYGRSLALAMIDVDFFKNYNDNSGVAAGDMALCTIGKIIRKSIRQSDLPFRYNGGRFGVIFPETSAENATVAADRIRTAVQKQRFMGESSQPNGTLTVSVGISMLGKDHDNPDELVSAADEALYKAKCIGRNRVVAFSKD